jgi:hypothetical protein
MFYGLEIQGLWQKSPSGLAWILLEHGKKIHFTQHEFPTNIAHLANNILHIWLIGDEESDLFTFK